MNLMRMQKIEEKRKKKDELIRHMALEQKQKQKNQTSEKASHCHGYTGGFAGIHQQSSNTAKKWSPPKRKQLNEEEKENQKSSTQDTELFILGMLKEQRRHEQ